MKYENIRNQVLEAILQAVDMGLIHGTSGNIAMKDAKDPVVAITPSGISYAHMTADQIAIVDLKTGEWLDGPFKPSSEVPMHLAVMNARPDVTATVHTHGMFATIAAMEKFGELKAVTPPQAEFVPVGIVPFTMPGADEVAEKVVDALSGFFSRPSEKNSDPSGKISSIRKRFAKKQPSALHEDGALQAGKSTLHLLRGTEEAQ